MRLGNFVATVAVAIWVAGLSVGAALAQAEGSIAMKSGETAVLSGFFGTQGIVYPGSLTPAMRDAYDVEYVPEGMLCVTNFGPRAADITAVVAKAVGTSSPSAV